VVLAEIAVFTRLMIRVPGLWGVVLKRPNFKRASLNAFSMTWEVQ
jgi:hypothetical protein